MQFSWELLDDLKQFRARAYRKSGDCGAREFFCLFDGINQRGAIFRTNGSSFVLDARSPACAETGFAGMTALAFVTW
jgi:hypothetical protein